MKQLKIKQFNKNGIKMGTDRPPYWRVRFEKE